MEQTEHTKWELAHLAAMIAKGHKDPGNLRELLICTTSKTTVRAAEQYFAAHHQDGELLDALVKIALEGADSGDAPWAAANTIAEFPTAMLLKHEAALAELAGHPWMYLHIPAKKALEKVRPHVT